MRLTFHCASVLAALLATELFEVVTALSIDRIRFSEGKDVFDGAALVP